MTFDASWTLGLEAHTRCRKCHFILPVNGPVSFVGCAKCGERRELTREVWDDALTMPAKMSRVMREGTTKSCQVGIDADALVMKATREAPRCAGCKESFDPAKAPESCGGCGKSLFAKDAPAFMANTHRALQRTFLGASEGTTSEATQRWYLWFLVDPDQVEADRKLAEAAAKRVEAKLPKLHAFDAPKRSAVVPTDEPPVSASAVVPADELRSAYRDRPQRELVESEPEVPKPTVSDERVPTMPRNVALFLIALAAALGFLLGRSL
jgi:hypothetical protein